MKRLCLLLALSMLLSTSCNLFRGSIDPFKDELLLYAEYANPNGNPVITIDENATSNVIEINDIPTTNFNDGRVNLIFNNIRFEHHYKGVYKVCEPLSEAIITEEFVEGTWNEDVENFLTIDRSLSLDYVLVLDASTSLGDDFNRIKEYAINFINLIQETDFAQSRFSLVTFSGDISTLPFSSDIDNAINFLDSVPREDETNLYEAIGTGVDLLENASTADGKAIIIFTDGYNNAYEDDNYETSDYVRQQILDNNISSYPIGFTGNGDVKKEILESLALNKGLFAFPETIGDIEKVFNKFANSVSAVYKLTYNRNDSHVSIPIPLRFRIKVELL